MFTKTYTTKFALMIFCLFSLLVSINANAQNATSYSRSGTIDPGIKPLGKTHLMTPGTISSSNSTNQAIKLNTVNPVKGINPQQDMLLKQEQAKLLKAQCPHYPNAPSTGVGTGSQPAFENWKRSFPVEYSAYLKIFNFKQ